MSVWVTPFNYSYLRAECEKVALRVDAPTAVVGQHDSEDLFAKRRGYSAMARQPGGVHVDEKSFQQLEELCEQIVDTTGLAASIMQVALMKEGEKRTRYMKTARDLSLMGMRLLKKFLWQWAGLREVSNCDPAFCAEAAGMMVLERKEVLEAKSKLASGRGDSVTR